MTVIDLGELRDDTAPEPPVPRRPATGRPYRSLVVLLLVLVTLAGAAPTPGRVVATVPGGPAAAAFVAGDRVYVVQAPDPQRGVGRQLVAYRVDPGPPRPIWRTLLPGDGVATTVWEQDGTVLLVGRTANDAGWETVAFDAGTGRVGWRQSGVAFPAGDGVVLQQFAAAGREPIQRVEVRTGRTRWSMPVARDELELSFGPAGVDRLVALPASGAAEVFDARTGVRLVARDLRPGELPARPRTLLAAGLLLLIRDAGGTVTGYDLDTLDPRWTVSIPLVGYAEPCGRLLCASRQTGGMWALDPASGAIRWTDDRWASALAAGGGRLLVAAGTPAGTELAVVEEASGRLVADLGDWELVPQGETDGRVIGIRRGGDGRLLVAELDPAAGRARVRDSLSGAVGDCRIGAAVLLCRRSDGSFGVWPMGRAT
ncbi:PQQ-binding-like beta-propeller repeat protein [Micromonospora soli]|uniref:outer membrane protein assembly factor BamB family protein n=1 Tax=Micromonospora sp. NBRC 110009 TaxID=3061627 RepID=UPI002672BF79|nr:PQQ-binding-like beta-propeller repeat protein [Micromonospora sp. NBRC 110009]WKT99413.1 PQQ-binding-like beta-propeller repeat protein [Micromonospora sp. NBRC 110009]